VGTQKYEKDRELLETPNGPPSVMPHLAHHAYPVNPATTATAGASSQPQITPPQAVPSPVSQQQSQVKRQFKAGRPPKEAKSLANTNGSGSSGSNGNSKKQKIEGHHEAPNPDGHDNSSNVLANLANLASQAVYGELTLLL